MWSLFTKKKHSPELSPSEYHNMFGKDYDKMLPDPKDIDEISQDQIEELSLQDRMQILEKQRRLTEFAFSLLQAVNIPEEHRQRLIDLVISQFGSDEDSDEVEALLRAFEMDSPIEERVFCFIDWKASDQIDWQISEIASRIGLQWDAKVLVLDTRSTDEVLILLGDWLRERGFTLIQFQTAGDDYLFTVVPGDATMLLNLADEANVPIKIVSQINGTF